MVQIFIPSIWRDDGTLHWPSPSLCTLSDNLVNNNRQSQWKWERIFIRSVFYSYLAMIILPSTILFRITFLSRGFRFLPSLSSEYVNSHGLTIKGLAKDVNVLLSTLVNRRCRVNFASRIFKWTVEEANQSWEQKVRIAPRFLLIMLNKIRLCRVEYFEEIANINEATRSQKHSSNTLEKRRCKAISLFDF